MVANFLREARAGVAFASSGRFFEAERASGTEGLFGSVDLSWAYRPLGSRWSLLDRLEFRLDQLDGGTGVSGLGSVRREQPHGARRRDLARRRQQLQSEPRLARVDREGPPAETCST